MRDGNGFLICTLVYRLKTNRTTADVSLFCFGAVAVTAFIAYLEFG